MPFFAKTIEGEIIQAHSASREKSYFCTGCTEPVILKKGRWKRDHFSHKSQSSCSLEGKSLEHQAVQNHLLNILPKVTLERRFPSIDRIADVFWKEKNIVFEVQVSPITYEEVLKRNRDYAQLGIDVIWIFHKTHFGRKKRKKAERALHEGTYYYTDIDQDGQGTFYDKEHKVVSFLTHLEKEIKKTPLKWYKAIFDKILDAL